MKNKLFLIIFIKIALITGIAPDAGKNIFAGPSNIKIDNIDLPSVGSLTTKNGIRALFIKEDLPRLIIVASVGFGKIYENNRNAGISDLIARTLALAGSKKYPADVLHDSIENIGGRFSVASSFEETHITIEVLEEYADLAFDIIKDIITNPNLDTKILESARSLLLEDVRRKKDNPEMLAFEKAREVIFNGRGYGSLATEESLKSITKNDMMEILNRYFTAKNIIFGISGYMDAVSISKKFENFKMLKEGNLIDYAVDINEYVSFLKKNSGNIYFLPKDIPQATIVVGTIAPGIRDENVYSLTLMNDILGGSSFNSRLMQEIRVKRGLAYSAQSLIRFRKNTGVFFAYVQTKNESAVTALSLLLENIQQLSDSPVKDEELTLAKNSIRNSYIFEFDTPMNILKQFLFLNYNGLPESFIIDFVKKTENTTADELQKSASRMFKNGLIKIIIGRRELGDKLNKFGKVVFID